MHASRQLLGHVRTDPNLLFACTATQVFSSSLLKLCADKDDAKDVGDMLLAAGQQQQVRLPALLRLIPVPGAHACLLLHLQLASKAAMRQASNAGNGNEMGLPVD